VKTLQATQTTLSATTADLKLVASDQSRDYSIDPVTLAYIDYGLFKSLRKLGVSRERICSALSIAYQDYDYLHRLLICEVTQAQA
jgi:hypothetical protein